MIPFTDAPGSESTSPFSAKGGHVPHSPQEGGHVLQTLFPKSSDGGDVTHTLSLHCFLFCRCNGGRTEAGADARPTAAPQTRPAVLLVQVLRAPGIVVFSQ